MKNPQKGKPKDSSKTNIDSRTLVLTNSPGKESLKEKNRTFYFLAGILILTIFLYAHSLKGDFLNWDDHTYINDNTSIHKLDISHIKEIFTTFYASNYHPLTSLTWAIEYSLAGDKSAFLYRFDNLLLHLLNVIIVFWLFKLISKKNTVALLVALLHAVHPMHVESVAWISERKDLLYSFFFLLSLSMYVLYLNQSRPDPIDTSGERKNKTAIYLTASFVFFLLSLLSKSAAVVLPLVLSGLDYLSCRKITLRMFVEKIPFLALSVLFGILALQSQQAVINDAPQFSFLQKLIIINHTFIRYVFMALVPDNFSAYHPWPPLTDGALPFQYYISPAFTILIIAGVYYSLRRTRIIAFGTIFFLLGLVLILQFVPVGVAVMAERYSYISYLGLFFILATYFDVVIKKNKPEFLKTAMVVLLVIFTGVYSFASYQRVSVWNKDRNLWDDMISSYPNTAYIAYYNRAKFRHETRDERGAIEDLSKLIEWKKYYAEALTLRGSILADGGNIPDAIKDYTDAIAFDSSYYLAYNNRGSAEIKLNDFASALEDLNKAIQLKKNYGPAWFNRGSAKTSLKDFKGGLDDFDESLRLNPSYCLAYFGKGNALSGNGMYSEAIETFTAAVSCKPDYTDAYINRGNAKLQLNDLSGAADDFSAAIKSNPGYPYSWFNRGRIKAQLNDLKGAEEDIQQSLLLNPSFTDAYSELGNIRFKMGNKAGACESWNKGAALGNPLCIQNSVNICK